jgi:acyl-CoA thioesterase YciA
VSEKPSGEPAIRVLAMPSDTNPAGDIFGGWLMSQMDIGGASVAVRRAHGRVVTIAVDGMIFVKPVFVGDVVTVYGTILKVGRTSIRVQVEAWARRDRGMVEELVTQGVFTYVAVGPDRQPRPVPEE